MKKNIYLENLYEKLEKDYNSVTEAEQAALRFYKDDYYRMDMIIVRDFMFYEREKLGEILEVFKKAGIEKFILADRSSALQETLINLMKENVFVVGHIELEERNPLLLGNIENEEALILEIRE